MAREGSEKAEVDHRRALARLQTRFGITAEEAKEKTKAGFRWCWTGKHWAPVDGFSPDAKKPDGLRPNCRACRSVGGPGSLSEKRAAAGRKGGAASARNLEGQSKAGKVGGKVTAERYGSEHMAELGRESARKRANDPEKVRAFSQAGQEGMR